MTREEGRRRKEERKKERDKRKKAKGGERQRERKVGAEHCRTVSLSFPSLPEGKGSRRSRVGE